MTLKARKRPLLGRITPAVFDGVVVDVVDMVLQVGVITDRVLPITPLPDTLLSFVASAAIAKLVVTDSV